MEKKDKIEEYIVDNIRKIIINTKLPSVFCINRNINKNSINKNTDREYVFDNGINLNRSEIVHLQNLPKFSEIKDDAFINGIKINGIKFVVIEIIEDISGLIFIHAKSHEEETISLICR